MNQYIRDILDNIGANPYLFNFLQRVCNLGDLRQPLAARLRASAQDSILDVGCGTGLYSTLAKGRYLGIDLNESYIKYARSKYGNDDKRFMVGDVTNLDTKGELFDKTLYLAMLHHFGEEDNLKILERISALTRQQILILDLTIPEKSTPLQKFFLKVERGQYLRSLGEQLRIIEKVLHIKEVSTVLNRSRFGLFSIIDTYPRK